MILMNQATKEWLDGGCFTNKIQNEGLCENKRIIILESPRNEAMHDVIKVKVTKDNDPEMAKEGSSNGFLQ